MDEIIVTDTKGRLDKIKACIGHSISFEAPELDYKDPTDFLYHGTTIEVLEKKWRGKNFTNEVTCCSYGGR